MISIDNETLQVYRYHSDPLADNVIKAVMKNGHGRSIHELFNQLIENEDYSKIDLPEEIGAYFEETAKLPAWADLDKIKRGQEVFALYGPEICLILLCKSLPYAYACKKGAQVMFTTGRMTEGKNGSIQRFTRRLVETSQFVMNVCSPGGFEPNGKAIITTQKVRLIHAAIRYFILKGEWDKEELGLPINQEDLAGTLQSFSALTIEGLKQLDIDLSNEQIDAYYHCWHVTGHIIGVDPELNPSTYKRGALLGRAIFNHQKAPSQAGTELTKAIIAFMENNMPGNLFNGTPEALIQFFIGEKIARTIGLTKRARGIAAVMPYVLKFAFSLDEFFENESHFFRKISKKVSIKMLQGLLYHFNEKKQIHFYIPPNLRDNWKLN